MRNEPGAQRQLSQEEENVDQRGIGDVGVSAIGLGGMPMSIEGRPAADQLIRARSVETTVQGRLA